jgi:hypothetical protein
MMLPPSQTEILKTAPPGKQRGTAADDNPAVAEV